ncbi:MAG: ASCH domain-containing protein [Verrucomicrobiota bacterium]
MKKKHFDKVAYISIREPWAWLILEGHKDVENRVWSWDYRGPLLIHAGKGTPGYKDAVEWVESEWEINMPDKKDLDLGCFVSMVDLVDCVEEHDSEWYDDEYYGLVVANPRRIKPIPFRGHPNRQSVKDITIEFVK